MKKVAYNAILRLHNYWSEGFIIVCDSKNIKGLFTIDFVEGILKNGKMILDFTGYSIDLKSLISHIEMKKFIIDIGNLSCPLKYDFSFEDNNCSLELVLEIRNPYEIMELEDLLVPFFPTI